MLLIIKYKAIIAMVKNAQYWLVSSLLLRRKFSDFYNILQHFAPFFYLQPLFFYILSQNVCLDTGRKQTIIPERVSQSPSGFYK